MGRRLTASGVLVIAALCAAAAPASADKLITFSNTQSSLPSYDPETTNAAKNEKVTWQGSFDNHPLVSDTNDFSGPTTGATFDHSFSRSGTYKFHCGIHGSMTGQVKIAGNTFATPNFSFSPASPQTGQEVTFTYTGPADPDGGTIVRYQWDLDGNASFETSTSATTTKKTYAQAGSITVSVRYEDDGHETSPATSKVVTVTAPAGGGGGGGGGGSPPPSGGGSQPPGGDPTPSGGSAGDTTKPRARLLSKRLRFVGGVATLRLTISEAGSATATVRRGRTVVATGRAKFASGGAKSLRLRRTIAGRRALRGARRLELRVKLTDRAGNTASIKSVMQTQV